jgi:iron complex outermembrane receptor protein
VGPSEGTIGLQSNRSDFAALGDEAFVPPVLTHSNSVFIFEELPVGKVRFQFGARYDHITAESQSNPNFGPGQKRTFDNFSGSLGMVYNPTDDYAIALSVAYSERAPTYQELYSGGPHIATGTFDVGDPTLGVESSIGVDLSLRRRTGWVTGSVSGYYNRFSNFIGQLPTGAVAVVDGEDFPVYEYRSIDAEFFGAELEATVHLLRPVTDTPPEDGLANLDLEFRADVVRARDRTTGNSLPRIPPFHLTTALAFQKGPFGARLEGTYAAPQDRVSPAELPTDSYFLVNAAVTYTLVRGPLVFDFYLKGTNLTDAEAREHTSFLKDRVPLAGRGLVVGMKTSF